MKMGVDLIKSLNLYFKKYMYKYTYIDLCVLFFIIDSYIKKIELLILLCKN